MCMAVCLNLLQTYHAGNRKEDQSPPAGPPPSKQTNTSKTSNPRNPCMSGKDKKRCHGPADPAGPETLFCWGPWGAKRNHNNQPCRTMSGKEQQRHHGEKQEQEPAAGPETPRPFLGPLQGPPQQINKHPCRPPLSKSTNTQHIEPCQARSSRRSRSTDCQDQRPPDLFWGPCRSTSANQQTQAQQSKRNKASF